MNLVRDPRAVGEALRYSTWKVIEKQSIGEHTWQVIRILLTIWPEAPRNVLIYAVAHDMGEMAGDIQYPFKNLFPELRAGADKSENYVRHEMDKLLGIPKVRHSLSGFEHQVFKACDNLDMWEYGMREVNMGNRYAMIIVNRMRDAVANNLNNLEGMKDIKQFKDNEAVLPSIKRYMQIRQTMENFNGQE
jgi:5'-deoxynucleotidase YfbR-like HD superfamily hydrolase